MEDAVVKAVARVVREAMAGAVVELMADAKAVAQKVAVEAVATARPCPRQRRH